MMSIEDLEGVVSSSGDASPASVAAAFFGFVG
jgi:hypothetical protein